MNNKFIYSAGILTAVASGHTAMAENFEQPNIIIIYVDDMGYGDLECYGAKGQPTPHIDKMAQEGIRFTNFYSPSNLSSPSRAGLLSGCYPLRAGMPQVLMISDKGLSYEIETLAEMVKDEGYSTALIGKWHLGHHKEFLPMNHGFDYFYGTPFSHDLQLPDLGLPFYVNDQVLEYNPDPDQLTTRYTEEAQEYIRQNHDKPFFLWLCHNMPHTELAVSDKFRGKSENGLFGDVVMELDWSVGEILKELEEQGIDRNTLVIFSSDNGPSLKQGAHSGSAEPFREGKGTTFEGGHRVPAIFYMPSKMLQGVVCDDIASQIDIYPTVAQMIGAKLPNYKIDGISLLSTLVTGEKHSRQEYFFYANKTLEAYRNGNKKYHIKHKYRDVTDQLVDPNGHKFVSTSSTQEEAVYNLAKDQSESQNLIKSNSEFATNAQKRMNGFHQKLREKKFTAEVKEE